MVGEGSGGAFYCWWWCSDARQPVSSRTRGAKQPAIGGGPLAKAAGVEGMRRERVLEQIAAVLLAGDADANADADADGTG